MISKNGIGIALLLVAQLMGLDVNETEIQLFIQNALEIAGFFAHGIQPASPQGC